MCVRVFVCGGVVCDVNWFAMRSEFANGVVSTVNRSLVILGDEGRQDSSSLNISALAERLRSHVAVIGCCGCAQNAIIEDFLRK